MSTTPCVVADGLCADKDARLQFQREFASIYHFGAEVPSMPWWLTRLAVRPVMRGWQYMRVGAAAYVRPIGAPSYRLRHHWCSDDGAVAMSADAAGIVLSICALVWEGQSGCAAPRVGALLEAVAALARTHPEARAIGQLVFPLERLTVL